ncbi:MAG: beta strand repeat-containing protein, partial [Saprospiraceae bacterium]
TSVRAGGGIEENSMAGMLLTLTDVDFLNNSTSAAPGNGGGLHITGAGNSNISGGAVSGNIASSEGGGLWNGTGTMTIDSTDVNSNTASGASANEGGGGLFNAGGTLVVMNAIISNNIADGAAGSGGGILNDLGTLTVSNSTLSGNTSIRAGGGIEEKSAAGSILTLTNVNFTDNSTAAAPGNGGGLHITGAGDSNISGGLVDGNTASLEGGGLWNGSGTMTVDGTTIDNNTASGTSANEGGGGLFNAGGTLIVMNATISNNVANGAAGSGGGILNDMGTLTVSNSEINDNTSMRAGGGIEDNSQTGGLLNLTEVNLTDNMTGASPGNGGGLHITGPGDSNISGGTTSGNVAAAEGGGLWNGSGIMTVNGVTIENNIAQGVASDNGGGGVFNNGGTLNIENATTINNNQATGASGSGGGLLSTTGIVTVDGSFFTANSANRAGGAIELIDGILIFTNSEMTNNDVNGTAGMAAPGNGGGLHITGMTDTITISNSLISDNEAGREGGGLWNQSGSVMRVMMTTIDGNSSFGNNADDGGAGIFNNGGTLEVMSSTISNNTANGTAGSGGGIHNITSGDVTVMVSTISGNMANGTGGGIYNNGNSFDLNATTIANNTATTIGGGIDGMTNVSIKNTIVASNSATSGMDVSGILTSNDFNLVGNDDLNIFSTQANDLVGVDAMMDVLADNGGMTFTHKLLVASPAYNAGAIADSFNDQIDQAVFGGTRDIGAYESQEVLTSVEDNFITDSGIVLFPNPTNGQFNITIPESFGEDIQVTIYELSSGKMIQNYSTGNGNHAKSFNNLNSGMYSIKLVSEKGIAVQMLTVAK